MNKNYLYIIGGIIAVIFIFSQMKKEALGTANWPSDCSFITNVDPYTQRPTGYSNSGAWIAIDYNNDGIKEKFGMVSSSTSPGQASWTTLVVDYNNYGDDIKTNGVSVYVVYGSGYARFNLDAGSASSAITTCGATPEPTPFPACPSTVCNDNIVSYDEAISILNKWISG